jgi:NAD-dependent dihydropyrimidine dehydrogenase PreA subunit
MSQENVEIVRKVYEAFNRRDWDAAFRDAHPDFEITTLRGPTAGTRRGRRRVTEFAEDLIAAFDKFIWEPEEFFKGGEMLYIDPDECIDCDACVEACPVDAITPEDQVPAEWQKYIQINADYYKRQS